MDRIYESGAVATPPAAPLVPSVGYPQADIPGVQAGTVPGAHWFHMITESLRQVIVNAGLMPDHTDLDLLSKAINATTSGSVATISASGALSAAQCRGLILVDASAGDVLLTLPETSGALGVRDVIVRRVDNTANKVVVSASGSNRVMHNLHLNAAGYSKTALFGAGDWVHLCSDTSGHWWQMDRLDTSPIGRPMPDSSMLIPPGGWLPRGSLLLSRADLPWLWDHAQQSGAIVADVGRSAAQGSMWTTGDGSTTFRLLELQGEYLRVLDEVRGVHPGQTILQWEDSQNKAHTHTYTASNFAGSATRTTGGSDSITHGTRDTSSDGGTDAHPRGPALPYRTKMI